MKARNITNSVPQSVFQRISKQMQPCCPFCVEVKQLKDERARLIESVSASFLTGELSEAEIIPVRARIKEIDSKIARIEAEKQRLINDGL